MLALHGRTRARPLQEDRPRDGGGQTIGVAGRYAQQVVQRYLALRAAPEPPIAAQVDSARTLCR